MPSRTPPLPTNDTIREEVDLPELHCRMVSNTGNSGVWDGDWEGESYNKASKYFDLLLWYYPMPVEDRTSHPIDLRL